MVYMVQRSRRARGRTHSPRKKACGAVQGRAGRNKGAIEQLLSKLFNLIFSHGMFSLIL